MFGFNRSAVAESAPKQSEIDDFRRALFAGMAIIEFSPDGHILAASEKFCALTGYAEQELVGNHHRMLCTSVYAQSPAYNDFWRRLASGEAFSDRFKRLAKGQHELWLEASYMPVRDQTGRVCKVSKIATDISQQVADQSQQASELAAIDRSMAVIRFNLQGEVLSANDNFSRVMGYRKAEVVGQHHRIFCESEFTSSSEYQAFWEALGRGEFLSGLYKRLDRQGREVWLRASYNPLINADGRVFGVIKYATDVTDAVTRQLQESSAAEMAMGVAAETAKSAGVGGEAVAKTVQSVREIAKDLNLVSEDISLLSDQSEKISAILELIENVADQTNLLALNAAIEAARAGEAGRGFSVVADEVRKLAGRTREATDEIKGVVQQNTDLSARAVSRVTTSQQQFAEGIQVAEQASEAMRIIGQDAQKVVAAISQFSQIVER